MEAVFPQAQSAELGTAAKIAIRLGSHVSVLHHAVFGYSDRELLDVAGSVEEFPVFVGFECLIPAKACDGFFAREKRIAAHVAPRKRAFPAVLCTKHPNPPAIHQRCEAQGTAS